MIVAIDGPAGSGKSTTAREVARRLGYLYLDTGAMYRAVALAFMRRNIPATPEAAEGLLPLLHVDVHYDEAGMRVLLDGEDVSEAIRQPEAGQMASRVATLAAVRRKMVAIQRRVGLAHAAAAGVIVDGRDIGTVVFPEADLKIFMVADPDVRARRRQKDLEARGIHRSLEMLRAEIQERDRQDAERTHSPLRKAPDALELDTTKYTFDAQVQYVIDRVRERIA